MSPTGRGYRGTLWDWTVIPLVIGLFLLGNGLTTPYFPTAITGAIVVLLSAWGWWRRRNAVR